MSCSIEGCNNKVIARGLCTYHYQQQPDIHTKHKALMKIYNHLPEVEEKKRIYLRTHREEHNKTMEVYRQRPEINEREKKYKKNWRESGGIKYLSEYYYANRDKLEVKQRINEYRKIKRRTDIRYNTTSRLRGMLYAALKHYGNGKTQSSRKYGICWDDALKKLVETKPLDFTEKTYHIDHIKPLSSFDLTDIEQIKQAFAPENLQWLTAEENIRKSNKIIEGGVFHPAQR